jgi:hypothetical protein
MAFTIITITASFETAAGQPASGRLTMTLSAALRNGTEVVDPTPIAGVFNEAGVLCNLTGELPYTLVACNDPATLPLGAVYDGVLELDAAPVLPFIALIAYNAPGATVDLSTFLVT